MATSDNFSTGGSGAIWIANSTGTAAPYPNGTSAAQITTTWPGTQTVTFNTVPRLVCSDHCLTSEIIGIILDEGFWICPTCHAVLTGDFEESDTISETVEEMLDMLDVPSLPLGELGRLNRLLEEKESMLRKARRMLKILQRKHQV